MGKESVVSDDEQISKTSEVYLTREYESATVIAVSATAEVTSHVAGAARKVSKERNWGTAATEAVNHVPPARKIILCFNTRWRWSKMRRLPNDASAKDVMMRATAREPVRTLIRQAIKIWTGVDIATYRVKAKVRYIGEWRYEGDGNARWLHHLWSGRRRLSTSWKNFK